MVPIVNSLAFLFTVLGDWYVDRKVISRGMLCSTIYYPSIRLTGIIADCYYNWLDTWFGMALSLGGIALCVQSKTK
jgi:hypothetical protein